MAYHYTVDENSIGAGNSDIGITLLFAVRVRKSDIYYCRDSWRSDNYREKNTEAI